MKKILIILTVLLIIPAYSRAQGICVIEEMQVKAVKGLIISTGYPVENAVIKLFKRKAANKPLKQLRSDAGGYFEILDVAEDKYTLEISYPRTRTLYIPLKVSAESDFDNKLLKVNLGVSVGVPCGGGGVSLTELDIAQTGRLTGSTIFVDASERQFLREAAEAEIKLKFNEKSKVIKTDFKGDFILPLPVGKYCLSSVADKEGATLELARKQSGCFEIKSNKETRFDIALLDGKAAKTN